MAIVALALVMTVRTPVTIPPTTTRWPSSDSSLQVARVGGHELADLLGDLAHRVLGEVQPEQLLLPAQPLADRRLGRGRERPLEGGRVGRAEVEQRGLAGDPVALGRLGRGDRVVEAEQDLGRVAERARARRPWPAPRAPCGSPAAGRSGCRSRSASGTAPPSSRAAMIDSIAPWPTFLTASSPNRIASPSTVNSRWLRWTSGGRTSIAHPAALGDGRRDLLLVRRGRRSARAVMYSTV